jgi:UDP-3-O-[3-hydroxymyristoyl] glucosamine N-acyltransferase
MILSEMLSYLGADVLKVIGKQDRSINAPASILRARDSDIAFYSGAPGRLPHIECRAGVVLCRLECEAELSVVQTGQTFVLVKDPRLAFAKILGRFFAPPRKQGIHPTAVIAEDAVIEPSAFVGAYTVIDEHCVIGANCWVGSHVHLYARTRLARNVIVHSGTIIGADGFGYQRDDGGDLWRFPHLGGVDIEDDVEIGSNTSIDRGSLDSTIIGAGSKIDNQVHVAHNVVLGKRCIVVAQSMIGGSTSIGDDSWIAPSVSIRDGLHIGSNVFLGMGSIVVKNVPNGETVIGAPARPADEFKRLLAWQSKSMRKGDAG